MPVKGVPVVFDSETKVATFERVWRVEYKDIEKALELMNKAQ